MLRYRLLLALLTPVVWSWLWLRGKNESAYRQRWRERLGFVNVTPNADVWIHGASLGELVAAKLLIDAYLQQQQAVLITAFTPAGSDYVQRQFAGRVQHCYLPIDWPGAVRRFLQRAKPQRLVVLETELWPNLLAGCHKQAIDVRYASARITDNTVTQYQKFLGAKALRDLLTPITAIATQTEGDAQRFIQLGASATAVTVTGNIKFDLSLPEGFDDKRVAVEKTLTRRRVLLAASTHAGEEQAALAIYQAIKPQLPELLLVIAPRHQNRFDEVAGIFAGEATVARRSQQQTITPETDVYLADSLGELMLFYAAAEVTFVGGSLAAVGGHNVLEPALVETAVVVGPHLHEQPVAQQLAAEGAILQGQTQDEVQTHCAALFANANQRQQLEAKAAAFLAENRGALARTLGALEKH